MPEIYLCFVWHMHQPFYKDLLTGEYNLPWTRMHALKDYYGMVKVLDDFPAVRQTFNLVPSMMVQIQEYAEGKAADPFLRCALKPAEDLTEEERAFLLRYFFQANPARMIRRYARYGELFDGWLASDRNPQRARHFFSNRNIRDLQVLSQLAWFDEEFLAGDAEVKTLIAKGRDYTIEDQALMGGKQLEILAQVLPVYREFAARGQIEISTTPFYHPILPLLCDSDIAGVSHPFVPLPRRFRYPDDAAHQLRTAMAYMEKATGTAPRGLWPSEGSVSDEALGLAAGIGFQWAATDNGVLARTIDCSAGVEATYRPYVWRQAGRELKMIFRDHYLSDLIGFVYSRMDAAEAAGHFLDRIRENCAHFAESGRPALVPVILDGENAWEYYEESGRPFLRELYSRISADPRFHAVTVSEALQRVEAAPLDRIFPGSWIGANFDVWIGAEEDNRAWELLLRARQAYDNVIASPEGAALDEARRKLAYEELLIAEGSDWNWWYGPEHQSDNRPEFDHLFRAHLANVYRALNLTPPEELSQPILKSRVPEIHDPPTAFITPTLDGEVSSYFEWMGAGLYKVDQRSGAMHGRKSLVEELHYGSDGKNVYLRLDLKDIAAASGVQIRITFRNTAKKPSQNEVVVELKPEGAVAIPASARATVCLKRILEVQVPLKPLKVNPGEPVLCKLSVWQGALPMDALPPENWIAVPTSDPAEWPV